MWARNIARALYRKLPPGFDLEDIEQVALLKTWQRWQTWDPPKNDKFQGYAYMAVYGQVRMAVRRQAYFEATNLFGEAHFEAGGLENIQGLKQATPSAEAINEAEAAKGELSEQLDNASSALTDIERQVIEMHFHKEMRIGEVAKALGLSAPATSAIKRSALAKMKTALAPPPLPALRLNGTPLRPPLRLMSKWEPRPRPRRRRQKLSPLLRKPNPPARPPSRPHPSWSARIHSTSRQPPMPPRPPW